MRNILLLIAFVSATLAGNSQAGTLNPNFGINGMASLTFGKSSPYAEKVVQVLPQPDGRFVAVMVVNGETVLGRYYVDGSLDGSFGSNGYVGPLYGFVATAATQANGEIVIVGDGSSDVYHPLYYSNYLLMRFSTDGNYDYRFDRPFIHFSFNFVATSIAVQEDGKIVVGGYTKNGTDTRFALLRCNHDGSQDETFAVQGKDSTQIADYSQANAIALQKDGKIVLAGAAKYKNGTTRFALARYTANGLLDTSFSADGKQLTYFLKGHAVVNSLAIQEDQKIVAGGYAQDTLTGSVRFALARYNIDGSLDSTLSKDGKQTTLFGPAASKAAINAITIQTNGKIVTAGYTNNGSAWNQVALARYNADGYLDKSFSGDGQEITASDSGEEASVLAVDTDGKLIVGITKNKGKDTEAVLARYTASGTLDHTFSEDGRQVGYIVNENAKLSAVAVQPDGKIVVAGTWDDKNRQHTDFAAARFKTDGTLDTTFSRDGIQITDLPNSLFSFDYFPDGFVTSVAIQPDGRIVVVGGASHDLVMVRYFTDGTLDGIKVVNIEFADEQYCYDQGNWVTIQKDGKIVVAGTSCDNRLLLRYNADGSDDRTFFGRARKEPNNPFSTATSVAIQQDGKIVVAGDALTRYKSNGALDSTFSGDGILAGETAPIVIVQQDGKIYAAEGVRISRYNNDGSIDNSFAEKGKQTLNSRNFGAIIRIFLQTDSKLLVIGSNGIARLNTDGSLDSTFSGDGVQSIDLGGSSQIVGAAIHNNQLYITGYSTVYDPTTGTEISKPIVADYQLGDVPGIRNWYRDADGDGFGNPDSLKFAMTQPAGYVADDNTDCNDNNKNIHPGAVEICDGIDNNCDGQIDEGVLKTFYSDYDGDGYGSLKRTRQACAAPPRYVAKTGDLNDDNATVYPGAPELCDGLDNDCNGKIDDGLPQKPFYWDHDKDGYGFRRPVYACAAPPGYISIGGDFNDNDPNIHPGAVEHCDGIDEDCDGIIDNGFPQKRFFKDRDGDGWGSNSSLMAGCAPPGYVSKWGDCNDNNAAVHPGATEVLGNGIDDNCNGQVDEITNCPSKDIVVNSEPGKCGATVSWEKPSIANSCPTSGHELEGFTFLGTFNGHDYYKGGRSQWPDANALAISLGGHLAAITSPEENEFITRAITDEDDNIIPYWIGLNDAAEEGHFVWSDGEPVTYTNLKADNGAGGGAENYVAFYSGGGGNWNDLDGRWELEFILEFEPCVPVKLVQTSSPTTGLHNGSFFPVGTTTITYQAKNAQDRILSTCSFKVTVKSAAGDGCSMLTQNKAAGIKTPITGLQLTAVPNPSTHYFTLHIQSNNNYPILLRITDAVGRLIELRQGVAPNTTLTIGHNYRPGMYIAEAVQEGKPALVKLVKTSQ